ncbi:MAG: hypothetical protein KatS3mg035_1035 [Bacteroidia bacterium]|nr:MAG: hypothetical protein KatS3mg035_1035 [Bacteroidia bacterium]
MITTEDVKSVAYQIKVILSEKQIKDVIALYPEEQEQDPTATWNLVVEKIIYDIIS